MLSVDFGGTNLRIADISGSNVRNKKIFPSPKTGDELVKLLGQLLAGVNYTVGVSVAGLIDPVNGHFINLSSQGITDYPFSKTMLDSFGVKTKLVNDCKAGALAQMYYGAAKGIKNFVYITFSTGIGSGIVIDGKVVKGQYGLAGEIGHMCLIPDQYPCNCGKMGCWNVLGSGLYFTNKGLDPTEQMRKARKGDRQAIEHFEWIAKWNGIGVANVINTLDPEVVVIGGSFINSWEVFGKSFFEHIHDHLCLKRDPASLVRLAELGDDGPMIGAWLNAGSIGDN